ncbi:succinate-semialdehyde dehydrogenase [Sesbania bispinosa]|nr:succinate-semialdehyde dehydrogenase [Sesbania bispinosa]
MGLDVDASSKSSPSAAVRDWARMVQLNLDGLLDVLGGLGCVRNQIPVVEVKQEVGYTHEVDEMGLRTSLKTNLNVLVVEACLEQDNHLCEVAIIEMYKEDFICQHLKNTKCTEQLFATSLLEK